MKNGITKQHSAFLYGIAIMFMIYHHLFCIPSRIQFGYLSVLDNVFAFSPVSVERTLAWFCKICVAIYAFISGYGLCRSLNVDPEQGVFKSLGYLYLGVLKKIGKVLFKLLIVLAIFIPLLILVNNRQVSFLEFLFNLIGYQSSLSGVYWYVNFYISTMLLYPLVCLVFTRTSKKKAIQIIVSLTCLSLIVLWMIFGRYYVPDREYFIIFIEGYLVSRFMIFEKISKPLSSNDEVAISIILLVSCFAIRVMCADEAAYHFIDMFIIIPFIYSVCSLVGRLPKLAKGLTFFGKYSTFIWLSHTFFMYDLMPRIITISGNSTVIFIESIVISLVAAILLSLLEKYLLKLFELMREAIFRPKHKTV